MQPALVIFDCDGVLVDSERLSHEVLRDMLAERGVVLSLPDTIEHFIGSSTQGLLDRVATLLGRPLPGDFLPEFKRRSILAFGANLTVVPGVPELLASLQLPFCVASNGSHAKMRYTLGHTGLLPLFEGRLFSADDVPRPKPAPDLFLHAARCLAVEAATCVVVEDTPTGVLAARAAGMRVLGHAALTPAARLRAAGADAVFGTMVELPGLLLSLSPLRP